jgi:hypothetical protein
MRLACGFGAVITTLFLLLVVLEKSEKKSDPPSYRVGRFLIMTLHQMFKSSSVDAGLRAYT